MSVSIDPIIGIHGWLIENIEDITNDNFYIGRLPDVDNALCIIDSGGSVVDFVEAKVFTIRGKFIEYSAKSYLESIYSFLHDNNTIDSNVTVDEQEYDLPYMSVYLRRSVSYDGRVDNKYVFSLQFIITKII